MTPAELSRIHAAAFTQTRPWSEAEFADFLESPRCFLVTKGESFALGRVLGPEAELLTLAVAPLTQGKGLGRACLAQYEATALAQGAEESFLEVAAPNSVAINLYLTAGYAQVAERRDYYQATDGSRQDALILRRTLKI